LEKVELDTTHQTWIFVLPLLMLATFSSILTIYGWMKRKFAAGLVYFYLLLNMTLWMLLYAAMLLIKDPQILHCLSQLEYVTIVAMPLLWLHFAVDFADTKGLKSPGTILLSLVLPILLIILSFTNIAPGLLNNHHEFLNLQHDEPGKLMGDRGAGQIWTYLHFAYSLVYFLIATVFLSISLIRNPKVSKQHSIILSLGILIPWIGIFTFIFRVSPIANVDPAPFAFTLSGALLAWGLNYNRFNNIVMIARRAVVDRMIDGLIVLDDKNLLLDINSSAQKIFRISISQVLRQPAETVFQSYKDVLENLRYYSRKHQNLQIQVGNDIFYYLLDINPLFDIHGGVLGKMLVFHDITSLKITEIKLIEAKAHAEQADNLKSAFLANMSHEIRTPMNAIIGFSNLLNDAQVSKEERDEFIEHIKNSGNSLLQLIDDIIDISKLDANQIYQENHRISITRLLAELFSYYNENLQEFGKKDVQLLVNGIRENVDWSVMADGVKINRIMRHLLSNAVKFTSSGFIEFGVKMESPDVLLFYVQDSGIGIAKEKQGMIFERFSRVMTGTRQEYGGTGMGLAISKGLTELMGGKIWVESNLGAGSTFFVSLPVSQIEEHPISESLLDIYGKLAPAILVPAQEIPVEPGLISDVPETSEVQRQDNWKTKVILVLEPEEMVYLNIEMILRQTRVNLFWAKSMKEAVNYLERNNPVDSVIASAQLSDSTVEDSIHFLTSRLPGIPIISIIPFEGSSLDRICRDLGCLTTIPKPIKPAHLLRALNPYMS